MSVALDTARVRAPADESSVRNEYLHALRMIERLHRLGPRAMGELLEHLGRKHLIRTSIESELRRFAALDPAVLHALGADQFVANPPFRLIEGGKP